jgi:transposase
LAEIFVAVLGASSLTYAEATWSQTLPDWIGAHVRMFRFFGAAPRLLVPDNLKSGVNKASFYDPEVNRSYGAMAAHYAVGILPARPRRPRDKAAVEAGVRFAQSYIVGRLRNVTFFSLAACNAAIAAALERMNGREMRRLGVSRRQLFEAVERATMQPLPQDDYEYADWHLARVGIDYHVEVQGFFYSVPHALLREQVDTRATARTVEVFHRGKRVASHVRRYGGPRHGTHPEYMPSAHRRYAEWTPERLQLQARGIGAQLLQRVIAKPLGRLCLSDRAGFRGRPRRRRHGPFDCGRAGCEPSFQPLVCPVADQPHPRVPRELHSDQHGSRWGPAAAATTEPTRIVAKRDRSGGHHVGSTARAAEFAAIEFQHMPGELGQ